MTHGEVDLGIADVRWDGPPSLATVSVLASVVADLRIVVDGVVAFDYPYACIVDIWDFLLRWRESPIHSGSIYDGGIEGEEGLLSICEVGANRWWVGGDPLDSEVQSSVKPEDLEDAIDRFGDVVRAAFRYLTGGAFDEWAREHPDWRRR